MQDDYRDDNLALVICMHMASFYSHMKLIIVGGAVGGFAPCFDQQSYTEETFSGHKYTLLHICI